MNLKGKIKLKEVLKETRELEERALEVRKKAVRVEIRRELIQKGSYILDLRKEEIGEVFLVDTLQGFFKARFSDGKIRGFRYTDNSVRMATEDELVSHFAEELMFDTPPADVAIQTDYIYLTELKKVARVVHKDRDKVKVEYIVPFNEKEVVSNETHTENYFIRTHTFSIGKLIWRAVKQEEVLEKQVLAQILQREKNSDDYNEK